MSLPPLNFTPREAAAVAVALSRSDHVLFTNDARSALLKIVAAMPEPALEEARAAAGKLPLLVQPWAGSRSAWALLLLDRPAAAAPPP